MIQSSVACRKSEDSTTNVKGKKYVYIVLLQDLTM